MPTDKPSRRGLLKLCLYGCGWLLGSGCSAPASGPSVACRVLIDGQPASDVRVTLLKIEAGEAIAVLEGSSSPDGVIMLSPIGQQTLDSATELVGMIESTGSSEWQLATPWSNPLTTPLKIKWPPASQPFDIELPRKAVRLI